MIYTLTSQEEQDILASLAREVRRGERIVEVGPLYGGITAILANNARWATVITIDNFGWHPEEQPPTSKQLLMQNMAQEGVTNVTCLEGDSREIGKAFKGDIALAWIDGGHSYEFVKSDLDNFGVKARVIALHDYNNPAWGTIKNAIDDFLKEHPEFYFDKVVGMVAVLRRKSLESVFSGIYKTHAWHSDETVSGGGSELARTQEIREELPRVIAEYNIHSILDAGCGDWNWMKEVDLDDVKVSACDIVSDLVEQNRKKYEWIDFFVADITKDDLPDVDLILCRSVLYHLSFENIKLAIQNMKKHGKYLMLTTHPVENNKDIADGNWRRVNLLKPPFSMPEPLEWFYDGPGQDGMMGLWNGIPKGLK